MSGIQAVTEAEACDLSRTQILTYGLALRARKARRNGAVSTSGSDTQLLLICPGHLHRDDAPAAVRARLGIVAERVQVREVVPNRSKCLLLLEPVLRKINFTAGGSGHPLEHCCRYRLQLRLPRADHVNH